MDQIKLAFETVTETSYFQDLLFQLHTCQEDVCTPDCVTRKSAIGITSIVLDTVDATVDKCKTPHGLKEFQIVQLVHEITPAVWSFYDLTAQPLDFGGYSMRNQVIHLAVYYKAKMAMQALFNFPGWK